MIYVGYQGIGKSSISGNGNIDLESSNFYVNGERMTDWYKAYCNIAEHLSNQGYNVYLSSHKCVRKELKKRNIPYTVIYPSLFLKDKWIDRLEKRYNLTKKDKDIKALRNAIEKYDESIKDLMTEECKIEIKNIDYDLNILVK